MKTLTVYEMFCYLNGFKKGYGLKTAKRHFKKYPEDKEKYIKRYEESIKRKSI